MKELGKLYVGVTCANCGTHDEGVPTDNGNTRCGKCGRFGEEPEMYCAKHDTDYSDIYPKDKHCPMCREEQNIAAQRRHEATRDPQIEPW